jgi:hypothetical protein
MLEVINKGPQKGPRSSPDPVPPHAALARRAYTCSAGCPQDGDKVLSGPYRRPQ